MPKILIFWLSDLQNTITLLRHPNINFDNHIDPHGFKFNKNELYFPQLDIFKDKSQMKSIWAYVCVYVCVHVSGHPFITRMLRDIEAN